jgi:hypothetical protein
MSTNLFRAILAIDAYNRGYLPRIANLGYSPIGNATIIQDATSAAAVES